MLSTQAGLLTTISSNISDLFLPVVDTSNLDVEKWILPSESEELFHLLTSHLAVNNVIKSLQRSSACLKVIQGHQPHTGYSRSLAAWGLFKVINNLKDIQGQQLFEGHSRSLTAYSSVKVSNCFKVI